MGKLKVVRTVTSETIMVEGKVAVTIPLTRGLSAIVDVSDFEFVSQWNWHATKRYKKLYARRQDHQKSVLMHRVICDVESHLQIDHINGNGLDNRRSNLRTCTHQQNQRNRPIVKGKSGYKGVSFNGQTNSWVARIWSNNERTYLGIFDTKEKAAMAYNRAAQEMHGEFAVINTIKESEKL